MSAVIGKERHTGHQPIGGGPGSDIEAETIRRSCQPELEVGGVLVGTKKVLTAVWLCRPGGGRELRHRSKSLHKPGGGH